MSDEMRKRLPERLAAWLDGMRRALIACETAYSPPGAKPGLPPSSRRKSGAPSSEVCFAFVSDTEDPVGGWRATLRVPAGAGVGTLLELRVTDVAGVPVGEGTFQLAGNVIPLTDGKGTLPLELFVGGLRDAEVSLMRHGGRVEGGALSFFGPEDM